MQVLILRAASDDGFDWLHKFTTCMFLRERCEAYNRLGGRFHLGSLSNGGVARMWVRIGVLGVLQGGVAVLESLYYA